MLKKFYFDTIPVEKRSAVFPQSGYVYVLVPVPANYDTCFLAAGLAEEDMGDADESWEKNFDSFLGHLLESVQLSLENKKALYQSLTYDGSLPCVLEFDEPMRGKIIVADGHTALWFWSESDQFLESIAALVPAPLEHKTLDWERVMPQLPMVK